ncbi:MAG: LCP family protein [Chloroflexota bacterium]
MSFTKSLTIGRPTARQIVVWVVTLALSIVLFIFLSNFVACWTLTSLPGMALPSCATGPVETNPEGTPIGLTPVPTLGAPQVELPPPWDGASRVTLLFIGLDYRDWVNDEGPPRSDTMILMTIDPLTRTAGILSIPRDMWVNIPGFGYGKINTAYALGEAYQLPGGGPGLAMKTVEAFIGVPVQYYAQVDFYTFEQIIDIMGGIEIDVPEEITIDPLGQHNTTTLEAGLQTLDGPLALAYARARYTEGGDVDRSRRQQQVILAIRDKVLAPATFPTLVARAPQLYQELSAGIHMNLSLDDALSLAVLGREISVANIRRGVIDYTMITLDSVTVNGQIQDIFKPIPDRIRVLRDEVFGGGALSPWAEGDVTQVMQAEAASVSILNGTYTEGLASVTADYFTGQGMNVAVVDNSAEKPATTIIIDHTGKPYVVRYLMAVMNLSSSQLRIRFDPDAAVDVEVILGNDWALNNPMP